MSLYSQLFDENSSADIYLSMLELRRDMFGRYRDIFLNNDGTEAIVYTRVGGDNRSDWMDHIDVIRGHKYYIKDYDDDYDSTYAYFVFRIPEKFHHITKPMATGNDPLTIKEKFDKEMKEMEDPNSEAYKRAMKIAKQIQEGIESMPDGGNIFL